MKFTKEDAFKELVKQMTANGEKLNLSERSVNEQVEALLPLVANDETELADFVAKTLPMFKTANANVRNDIAQGIREYKDNNPINPTPQNPNPKDSQNAEIAKLLERIEKMESESAAVKQREYENGIRKTITEKLRDKGVKDKEWVNSFLSEITITEDFDVDAKVESYLNIYNKAMAVTNPNVTPVGAGGKPNNEDDTIKKAAAIAKQNRLVGGNE
jgi:hypothetical protein